MGAEWLGAGMVICLERGADLHTAQLMLLPLTVSCFSKIQIGFTFLVPAHPGSPGQRAVKRLCVCVLVLVFRQLRLLLLWADADPFLQSPRTLLIMMPCRGQQMSPSKMPLFVGIWTPAAVRVRPFPAHVARSVVRV